MLSRTASDLYWMSRYLERAENLARMLDVSYSLSLMPQDGRGDEMCIRDRNTPSPMPTMPQTTVIMANWRTTL